MAQTASALDFNPDDFSLLSATVATDAGDVVVTYRFYKAIPYVARPVDVAYQSLNLSVPVAINGQAIDPTRAPVLFANGVGGFMPSSVIDATGIDDGKPMGPPPGAETSDGMAGNGMAEAPTGSAAMLAGGKRVSNARLALAAGFVVAEPGARGRTLTDAAGNHYGVAPAAIVDLKAAVRWLRHNAGKVPGNMDRIVSCGTSAGGALSTLLGATGDRPEYLPLLAEIGAADASDAIFATAAFCPITDLDHADMAYEWNWGSNPLANGAVDAALSRQLALDFGAYQASLGLTGQGGFGPLTADTLGPYLVATFLIPEATGFLAAKTDTERAAYLAQHPQIGWNGQTADFDWPGFLAHVGPRKKTVPAFDALDLSSGENSLFGFGQTNARHFTPFTLRATSNDPNSAVAPDLPATLAMMNPMPSLAAANPARSRHWWFRLGAKDSDTSHSVVANLDAQTRALGDDVSTRYYWDAGHGANEDAADFIKWIG